MDLITTPVTCELFLNKAVILNKWFFIPCEEQYSTDLLRDGNSTFVCSSTSKNNNYHTEWRYYKNENKYKLLYVQYNDAKKIINKFDKNNYIDELPTIGEVIIYCATNPYVNILKTNSLEQID